MQPHSDALASGRCVVGICHQADGWHSSCESISTVLRVSCGSAGYIAVYVYDNRCGAPTHVHPECVELLHHLPSRCPKLLSLSATRTSTDAYTHTHTSRRHAQTRASGVPRCSWGEEGNDGKRKWLTLCICLCADRHLTPRTRAHRRLRESFWCCAARGSAPAALRPPAGRDRQ